MRIATNTVHGTKRLVVCRVSGLEIPVTGTGPKPVNGCAITAIEVEAEISHHPKCGAEISGFSTMGVIVHDLNGEHGYKEFDLICASHTDRKRLEEIGLDPYAVGVAAHDYLVTTNWDVSDEASEWAADNWSG